MMNWYKREVLSSKYFIPEFLRPPDFIPVGNGKFEVVFHMVKRFPHPKTDQRYTLKTKRDSPIFLGDCNRQDYFALYQQLVEEKKLTTPQQERKQDLERFRQEEAERKELERKQRIEEQQKRQEEENKKPKQLELFSRKNPFEGGRGDSWEPGDVNKEELLKGIEIEFEHVADKLDINKDRIKEFLNNQLEGKEDHKEHYKILLKAMDIAIDHLAEIEDYYTRLDKMEEEAKKN